MVEKIPFQKSLFFLEDDLLSTRFEQLADELSQYHDVPTDGFVRQEEIWVGVFNIWLLFQPDKFILIESAEKTMYYSSNYIILNEIRQDHFVHFIKTHPDIAPQVLFLTALFLTQSLNEWLVDILQKENLESILIRNRSRHYFDAHKIRDDEEIKQFIEDQSHIVKAVMPYIAKEGTIELFVKHSYDKAIAHYHKKDIVVEN